MNQQHNSTTLNNILHPHPIMLLFSDNNIKLLLFTLSCSHTLISHSQSFLISAPDIFNTKSATSSYSLYYSCSSSSSSSIGMNQLSSSEEMMKEVKHDHGEEVLAVSQLMSLSQYLKTKHVDQELSNIICSSAIACIKISQELQRLPISKLMKSEGTKIEEGMKTNVQGEIQKEMDVVANEIFIKEVKDHVAVLASEEEDGILQGGAPIDINNQIVGARVYEIAFDPLDGSSNLDVDVPTGTIFGISPHTSGKPFTSSGRCLLAAGYAVYSSNIEFILSLGKSGCDGCAGFTLDQHLLHEKLYGQNENDNMNLADCFILSRPAIKCPPIGPYYSLNEGREPDWPEGLRRWIYDAKRGQTPLKTMFSSRYICSLCADFHRTLIKGGWAGNPRPHLRLLYEALPLAHIAEACGGKGSNGIQNLLDLSANNLHERSCMFLGSIDVINDLENYGDVQQGTKRYHS